MFGTRFAATVVVVFVIVTWFAQLLGPVLDLPDFVRELALTSHYGQPMVGEWDWSGSSPRCDRRRRYRIGTWGFSRRRDLVGSLIAQRQCGRRRRSAAVSGSRRGREIAPPSPRQLAVRRPPSCAMPPMARREAGSGALARLVGAGWPGRGAR